MLIFIPLRRAWPTPSSDTSVAPASSADAAKSPGENTRHFLPFSPSVKSPPAPVVPKRRYTFEVEDTGIGIPPEKREKVFENFVQAGEALRKVFQRFCKLAVRNLSSCWVVKGLFGAM